MLEGDRRTAVGEHDLFSCTIRTSLSLNSSIASRNRCIRKINSEGERNIVHIIVAINGCICIHRLGHFQVAHLAGVRERRLGCLILRNGAGIARLGCGEVFSRCLCYGVRYLGGQAFESLAFAMLQCEGTHAVRERHAAIDAADRRVAQRYREGELLLRLVRRKIGHHRLAHFQVALLVGILHDDDTHAIHHDDGNRVIVRGYRGGSVIVPGEGEGNRVSNRLVVRRSRSLLQIVGTGRERADQHIAVSGRGQFADFRTIPVFGNDRARFVAVDLELRAGKAFIILIHLAQLHIVALGVVGKGDVVLAVRNDGAIHRIAGSNRFGGFGHSCQDDLLFDLRQIIARMRGFCDRISRSGRNVGDSDGITVGDRQGHGSRLVAIAWHKNVTVVIEAVAIRIAGYRRRDIVSVGIVVVIPVHAIPRNLLAAEGRGVIVERNRKLELLV